MKHFVKIVRKLKKKGIEVFKKKFCVCTSIEILEKSIYLSPQPSTPTPPPSPHPRPSSDIYLDPRLRFAYYKKFHSPRGSPNVGYEPIAISRGLPAELGNIPRST